MARERTPQSRENVMKMVNRIAIEVAADESALRQQVVALIDDGRFADAKTMLRAWDEMAAGDVLKKHVDLTNDATT